eukprot:9542225-Alexandrium_andersonii.AAC.1
MPAPSCMHASRLQAGPSLREGSGPQGATCDATHRGSHRLCQPAVCQLCIPQPTTPAELCNASGAS